MQSLKVYYHGIHIGELLSDAFSSFIYTKQAIEQQIDLSPIAMPLRPMPYSYREKDIFSVPPLLRDSLPGIHATRVMDQWFAQRFGADYSYSWSDRLSYVGTMGMGALEFGPGLGKPEGLKEQIDLREQERMAKSKISTLDVSRLRGSTMGVGGYHPKIFATQNLETGEFFRGDLHHGKRYRQVIIKFGDEAGLGGKLTNNPRIEQAYHEAARRCGILTAETELLSDPDGHCSLLSVRFDRQDKSKIHMASLFGLLNMTKDSMRPGYGTFLSTAMKLNGDIELRREIVRRMVFNVLSRSTDDHAQNHAFLMDGSGRWRLSPAYDLNFSDDNNALTFGEQSMNVNGRIFDIRKADLIAEAEKVGVSPSFTQEVIETVSQRVSTIDVLLDAHGVSKLTANSIKKKLGKYLRIFEGKTGPP